MADIYLRSTDGNDADDGSTWALAKATLAAALTAAGAGGKVYVSQAHAETQASAMTNASPGTAAAPVTVICVNDGAAPPTTLAATATVTTTGNSAMTFSGFTYYYGITFTSGSSASGAAALNLGSGNYSFSSIFDTCVLEVGTTGTTSFLLTFNARDFGVWLINTNVKFHATAQRIITKGRFNWFGGTLDTSVAVPTQLFGVTGGNAGNVVVQGVDLSGESGALVIAGATDAACSNRYSFRNCKLHASTAALTAASISGPGAEEVLIDNCDSGDTNYKINHQKYQGSIVTETTIKRTGGASDGTTGFCWKMVSLATPQFFSPLESPPIVVWNDTAGSEKTLTVEIVHDSATALTDAEVWVEVDHLGTSGYPITSRVTDRKAGILATAADQATSTVEWTTTGITNVNKQKLVATFTPQEKGPVVARVMLAKASYTVYVCPKVTIA